MSFLRRAKVFFHPDVQLLGAATEPAAASFGEFGWFLRFLHVEHFAEEPASLTFAAARCGDLHMIDADYHLAIIADRDMERVARCEK